MEEEEVEGRMKARETHVRSGFFSNSERHSQRPVVRGRESVRFNHNLRVIFVSKYLYHAFLRELKISQDMCYFFQA